VLSRYVDGIMIRTFATRMSRSCSIRRRPVINGLTDLLHPCQILAGHPHHRQHLGSLRGKKVAWIGDGTTWRTPGINAAYGSLRARDRLA